MPASSQLSDLPGMHSLHWPKLHGGNMDRLLGQGMTMHGSSCQACQRTLAHACCHRLSK